MANQSLSPLDRHVALATVSTRSERATQQALAVTEGEALIARFREQARGQLAAEAIETAGALSALEGHLVQMAPLGAARYEALVNAFTIGATRSIVGL